MAACLDRRRPGHAADQRHDRRGLCRIRDFARHGASRAISCGRATGDRPSAPATRPGTDRAATTGGAEPAAYAAFRRSGTSRDLRHLARRGRLSLFDPHDVSPAWPERRNPRTPPATASPGLPETRASGGKAQRSLVLGHHQAAGASEVELLLSLRHPGHFQPPRGRLVCGRCREVHPVQTAVRRCDFKIKHDVTPGQLTLHADRGSPMKAKATVFLLADLGATRSHNRPHTSNDNPFSESHFKTLKYQPRFPKRFGCIEDAKTFCRRFFDWYNQDHHHSGIGLMTPDQVHYGQSNAVHAARQVTLDQAFCENPGRFVKKPPVPPAKPTATWINPPTPKRTD